MLTFLFHCIKNIGSTSGFVGKISYTNFYVYLLAWDQLQEFYKATENPNSNSTKNQHSDHCLPGRYALDEPNNRRPEHGKGHIDFSLTATGVHNKSEKISTVSNTETRIFGPGNRLSQYDSNFANGKSKKFNSKMQKPDEKPQTNVVGNYKLDRLTLLNSTSTNPSIFTNKISATAASRIYKKQFPYHSIVHLNQNSIQELIWWVNNLKNQMGSQFCQP